MINKTSNRRFVAVALAAFIVLPTSFNLFAQAQRAGEVAATIPTGQIERPSGVQSTTLGTDVLWEDLVTTAARGRVRIGLDDGSLLNVGSNARLRVVKHDAPSQQSELVLTFGEMRARTRLATPNASFTVRTNTAVIGVVGTDFWVLALPTETQVIVFEGAVRVTSLDEDRGSVMVGAGQQTTVGSDQPPAPPFSPSASDYEEAIQATNVGPPLPEPPGPRPPRVRSKLPWILGAVGAAIAVIVIVVATGEESSSSSSSVSPGIP